MRVRPRSPQISVAGGGTCSARTARLAEAVGREIAAAGAILVCGGQGGVMEAAARGAAAAGGTIVGLLPTYRHADGNAHLTVSLPTGLGHARNILVAAAGDAVVALPGLHGTLAEVALARVLQRPVVVLGAWRDVPGVTRASTPRAAVAHALRLARRAMQRRGRPRNRRPPPRRPAP